MLELLLKSKKKTNQNGAEFRTYFTDVMILVKGEEEKGKQQKDVTVKFTSDVDVKSITGYGKLQCYVRDIGFPRKYVITTEDDGSKKYPEVWIRGFESYTPIERDVENPFVTDEKETPETEIEEETDEQ